MMDLFTMPDIEELNGAWPLLSQQSHSEVPVNHLTLTSPPTTTNTDNFSMINNWTPTTTKNSSVTIPLCVCQQSKTFPFCDETHLTFNQETNSNLQPFVLSLDDYLTPLSPDKQG
jgi:CDGSH-type Zn-finger protein